MREVARVRSSPESFEPLSVRRCIISCIRKCNRICYVMIYRVQNMHKLLNS